MFEKALEFTLEQEGGDTLTNDPNDPGGQTKYGISKRSYPAEDIPNLSYTRAAYIYRTDYWDKCRCGELPESIATLVFDTAVNQGTDTAIRLLQMALGVQVDGIIGPMTLMMAQTRHPDFPLEFTVRRLVKYGNTKNYNIYGLGWVRRAMKCYEAAKV